MSNTTSVLDPGLTIPEPPRRGVRRWTTGAPRGGGGGGGRQAARLGALEEAMLAFSLGLALAWVLVEAALWLGGG